MFSKTIFIQLQRLVKFIVLKFGQIELKTVKVHAWKKLLIIIHQFHYSAQAHMKR